MKKTMDIRKFFAKKPEKITEPSQPSNNSLQKQKTPHIISPTSKKEDKPSTPQITHSAEKRENSKRQAGSGGQKKADAGELKKSRAECTVTKGRLVVVDSSDDEAPSAFMGPSAKRRRQIVESSDEENLPAAQEITKKKAGNSQEQKQISPDKTKIMDSKPIDLSGEGAQTNPRRKTPSKVSQATEKSPSTKPQIMRSHTGSSTDVKPSKKRLIDTPSEPVKPSIVPPIENSSVPSFSRSKYFGGKAGTTQANSKTPPKVESKTVSNTTTTEMKGPSPKKRVLPESFRSVEKPSPAVATKKETPTPTKKELPVSSKKRTPASQKKTPLGKEKSENTPEDELLPFTGLTFVLTGVLNSISREDMGDKIKALGAKVTSAVSGKTSYLAIGAVLEDGREVTEGKKYKDATRRGIPILTEEKLLEMVDAAQSKVDAAHQLKTQTATPINEQTGVAKGKHEEAAVDTKDSGDANARDESFDLWADKYRPKQLKDIIGNGDIIKKLVDWLEKWNARHLSKTVPLPHYSSENPGARAVLLSGPPGIGKTSTAMMLARHLGYESFELNASDARSKRTMDEQLVETVTNTALKSTGGGTSLNSRRLIIMDEVDGMSGSDRGGVAELIKIIKMSKVPIVCICNDRQAQKIRSLANHCFDLRFRRPTKQQIAFRMIEIAKNEGVHFEQNAAEMLAESVGNDIRQVLNALQMWAKTSADVRYTQIKDRMSVIEKDKILRLSNFDCAKQILSPRTVVPLNDRYEAYFQDYQLIPLLIQQNYIDAVKSSRNDFDKMERLSMAADSVADADLVNTILRTDQNWSLLPAEAICYVRAGLIADGAIGFPQFPSWLGKYSQHNKRKRLLSELGTHLNVRVTGSNSEIRLSYLQHLREAAVRPLVTAGPDSVAAVIEFLDIYGMSRDDLFELMPEFVLNEKEDFTKTMDSKTKAAFTRHYNKTSHKSQGIASSMGLPQKKKGSAAKADEEALTKDAEDEEDAYVDESDNESSDEELISKAAKSIKANKAPGSGKTKQINNVQKKTPQSKEISKSKPRTKK